jgi:hypothetical protein
LTSSTRFGGRFTPSPDLKTGLSSNFSSCCRLVIEELLPPIVDLLVGFVSD